MRRILLGLFAALSFAAIIPWTLKAADSTLSGLSAGGAVSGTDLFYDVQTVGVGGVKVTGTQIKTFFSASPTFTGQVTFPDTSTWSATGTIANTVTINGLSAGGTQCLQVNNAGLVAGSGAGCAGSASVSSVTSGDGSINANPTTGTVILTLGTAHSNTWTASQIFNSGLTATTSAFTTSLTGTTATFQTVTINNLTPTGPNCVQETGGLLQATNAACGSGSNGITQINAGSNITTSGSASSVTVAVITSPTLAQLTVSTAVGIVGWLTAPGVNMQTLTLAGNLTGTLASFTNLTATGSASVGLLTSSAINAVSGTITTLTGTNAWITNLTATGNGSIAALTGSNVNFVSGTITTLTSTNVWITNLTATTNGSISTLTGGSATFLTLTVKGLTPTGPNCLQETNGLVQATNAACGSGSGTPATGGPVLPTSQYLGGASGQLSPQFYVPATNTIANQGAMEGIALATTATATLATAVLQFNMPEVIPTSPMRLRLIYMANATTGNVSTWLQDALTSVSNSLGVSALTSETTKVIAITSADVMIEKKFALTQTPTSGSNQILTVLLNLTTTVGTTVVIQPSIIWE